jgi:hypothetical protein
MKKPQQIKRLKNLGTFLHISLVNSSTYRKPRKPRNPSGARNRRAKGKKEDPGSDLSSVSVGHWIGAGIAGFPPITGQPYPAPLISHAFNSSNYDSTTSDQPFTNFNQSGFLRLVLIEFFFTSLN